MIDLLEDDEYLLRESLRYVKAGQQQMRRIFQATILIHICLQHTQTTKKSSVSDLSVCVLAGELDESPIVEDMLATLRILDSEKLGAFLKDVPDTLSNAAQIGDIQQELSALLATNPASGPLRSEYNINSSVVKTTVVQQRVRLSKGKASLSEPDVEYTRLIDRLTTALQAYLSETLVNPQDLFMHEVFLFDLRNPLKETFAPRPRFAIERALASPFDYLLSSSDVTDTKISAKQPPTAILYQLYLESGALVNVHDLWQAFYSVFESDQGNRCDERVVMALFYMALSELKAFGMVKNSRKKIDHLAKAAWMGL